MRRLFWQVRTRIVTAWRRRFPAPCYVIIYDTPDGDGETAEQYYGYFSSPDEARTLWADFIRAVDHYENVRLCRVVEAWPDVEGER